MARPDLHDDGPDTRRAAARRTAWKLGAVALVIFTLFLLSGVLGR